MKETHGSTRTGRRVVPLLCVVVLAGCTSLPWSRNSDQTTGFARKPVVEKVDPNYLIAVDGTECVVDRERFAKIDVGDNVWCMWGHRKTR